MAENYRVSYTVGHLSFDIESTDKAWLEIKEKEYLAKLAEAPQQAHGSATITPGTGQVVIPQNLTINEFYKQYIKSKKITSRPDITVFFIYYLEKILKKDSIKTGDVIQCFADVSYPAYNNINMADILNQSKRKALLNSVNSQWSLTITGEDFVLNTMTGKQE
jgi:hypothetical protein